MIATLGGCRATRRGGHSRSSGTACARSCTRRAGRWAGEPQPARHHAAVPGAARARPGARRPRGDPRRGGGGLRRRPPVVPEAPGPDAPDLRARRARLAASDPVTYMIFDVLYLDGHSLMDRGYEKRARAARARAVRPGVAGARAPRRRRERDAGGLAAQGLEGIIAKRLDAPTRRAARERLGEGEEDPPQGRGDRRLAAGGGRVPAVSARSSSAL